jgi:hypothetical protein
MNLKINGEDRTFNAPSEMPLPATPAVAQIHECYHIGRT